MVSDTVPLTRRRALQLASSLVAVGGAAAGAQAADAFGFVPDLTFEGLLADVPPELEQEVLAVVREGLANIERHACASDAYVRVSTVDDLVVTIQDNGVGLDSQVCRRGLVNLESRALAHGGTFSATRRSPTGTHLRWRVPLHS